MGLGATVRSSHTYRPESQMASTATRMAMSTPAWMMVCTFGTHQAHCSVKSLLARPLRISISLGKVGWSFVLKPNFTMRRWRPRGLLLQVRCPRRRIVVTRWDLVHFDMWLAVMCCLVQGDMKYASYELMIGALENAPVTME